MKFVVGFAIDIMLEEVLLIKKLKPDWQAGHLNGVGGKCGVDEHPHDTIRREFYEETGIHIPNIKWRRFCEMTARDGTVDFFVAKTNKMEVEQMEAEEPVWVSYKPLPLSIIDNLNWLIPMAVAKRAVFATVHELG